jgi:predicted ester cyclase
MHGLNPKIEPKADIASGKHQRIATDTERNNVAAYGVFSGTHTGPGGPCEPIGKKTISDYVYLMQFTGDKISHVTKIWHSGRALKELGWA